MSNSRTVDMCRLYCVPRWSVVAMTRNQSVAEHSYRVAAIAFDLASCSNDIDQHAKFKIAWLALIHDAPEAETGDIPGNIKEYDSGGIDQIEALMSPWTRDGSREKFPIMYYNFVKYADAIEALCWFQKYHVSTPRAEAIRGRLVSSVTRASASVSPQVAKRGDEIIHLIMNDMEVVDGAKLDVKAEGQAAGRYSDGEGPHNLGGERKPGGSLLRAVHPSPEVPGGGGSGTDSGGSDPSL